MIGNKDARGTVQTDKTEIITRNMNFTEEHPAAVP
jgi:hypothetical protein